MVEFGRLGKPLHELSRALAARPDAGAQGGLGHPEDLAHLRPREVLEEVELDEDLIVERQPPQRMDDEGAVGSGLEGHEGVGARIELGLGFFTGTFGWCGFVVNRPKRA